MFYLIYISTASGPMADDDLVALLDQSRRKNADLGITGMLVYQLGNFMQLLEGDEAVVRNLFETIKRDKRHFAVISIITGTSTDRNFDDWSMGFCNLDDSGDLQRYEQYIRKNLVLREFQDDTRHAYDFMVMFSESRR